ncbi:MAG: 4-hydroxy-tetrahydrodipicolinate reductase [Deltaproteobacteria bacterium]|nr:4-hydroxy-tetrahydrodipicolinate reductase [Deltaproteobacteria bacterium]
MDLVVCGIAGRMGGAIARVIHQTRGVRLVGAVDRPKSPRLGKDAGELTGLGRLGVPVSDKIEPWLKGKPAIIDFTRPAASLGYLRRAAKYKVPIVVGTTGFSPGEWSEIKRLSRSTQMLVAPNMSVGVNLLLGLLGSVARSLGEDYDVEIVEMHHRFKKDAPSGTALALASTIAGAWKRDLNKVGVFGRKGIVGVRARKELGVLAVRAGDTVGEHSVIFGGLGERIEFVHRAHSRETFARGAVRAAQWLVRQKKGLYSMQDVLKLRQIGLTK